MIITSVNHLLDQNNIWTQKDLASYTHKHMSLLFYQKIITAEVNINILIWKVMFYLACIDYVLRQQCYTFFNNKKLFYWKKSVSWLDMIISPKKYIIIIKHSWMRVYITEAEAIISDYWIQTAALMSRMTLDRFLFASLFTAIQGAWPVLYDI